MPVEHAEEADLWPFNIKMLFVLWFQNVENDRDAVLVVVSYDALVRVGCVRLDDAALLGACLRRLVVLQLNRLWVQGRRVLAEEQRLHFHELYV